MTLADVPSYYLEALALHSILCKIGFSPDQLYFCVQSGGLGVSLRTTDHERAIKTNDLPPDVSQDEIASKWPEVVVTWNSSSPSEQEDVVNRSNARKNALPLMFQLSLEGISPEHTTTKFTCPFCSRWIVADEKAVAVIHTMPPCEKFLKMEPDVYLQECRRKNPLN